MHTCLHSAFSSKERMTRFYPSPPASFHTHTLVVHTFFTLQADNENTKSSRENHLEDNANLHTKNRVRCV